MSLRNRELQKLFRCSSVELKQLKFALKLHMQQTYVKGSPLFGQALSQADPDGIHFENIWQDIAATDAKLASMLSGDRWMGQRPPYFDRLLRQAQVKMMRDFISVARTKHRKPMLAGLKADSLDTHSTGHSESELRRAPSKSPPFERSARVTRASFDSAMSEYDPFVDASDSRSSARLGESRKARSDRLLATQFHTPPYAGRVGTESVINSSSDGSFDSERQSRNARYFSSPVLMRRPLSERIREATEIQVSHLERRIRELEDKIVMTSDLDHRDRALEAMLIDRMQSLLSERDDENRLLRSMLLGGSS